MLQTTQEAGARKYLCTVWTNIISVERKNYYLQSDPQYHPMNWKKRSLCPVEIIEFNNDFKPITNGITDDDYFQESLNQSFLFSKNIVTDDEDGLCFDNDYTLNAIEVL